MGVTFTFQHVREDTTRIQTGWMKIEDHITKGSAGHLIKCAQHVWPFHGVQLHQQIFDTHFVSGALERYNVVGIARDGLGKFAWRKEVLCQIQDGDVTMMQEFGEDV